LGWGRFHVSKELEALTGLRVVAGNDATVAALGECWKGGGQGCSSMVMVTLGTGVGGGIIVDGKPLHGTHGAAGEIGHIVLNRAEKRKCNCGKRGCLEQYASATGIVRLANRMLTQCDTPSQLRSMDRFSAKDICDLAREGEEMSASILDRCGYYLGLAMSYVSCTIDPQLFIIGGGMSRGGQVVIKAIRRHFQKFAFSPSAHCPIVLAQLGNDAGIYGGAKLVLG
jgi:glucokinase